ncbi:MAG: Ig-like domain-containing protein [Chitinophagales bacterium]
MKGLIQLVTILLFFAIQESQAITNKYRLMWRDNPATTMTIGWNQVSGNEATVYYGTNDFGTDWTQYPLQKNVDRTLAYRGMQNKFAHLSDLQANTAYYFVIKDSEGTSQRFWFKTAPDSQEERLSIIAGGDSRNNRVARQNANLLVSKLRPHVVAFGGDYTSSDTDSQWSEWFDDWQLTIASDGKMTPIIATRGNHESNNAVIVNLFDVPHPEAYYGLTFADGLLRTYTLNSEIVVSGSQEDWLVSDMAAHGHVVWKMAQYHRPIRPHTFGKANQNDQYLAWALPFYEYGMNLIVECDAHTVKTTWPVKPVIEADATENFELDECRGNVYVGEGCWGAPLRANNDDKAWTRASGSFNQFNWIFVDADKMEIRTVKVDNAADVESVSDTDIFTAPANLDIWNPATGSVITIDRYREERPTATLTWPLNNMIYTNTNAILLQATATDSDGEIAKVHFFVDGDLVSTDFLPPYRYLMNFSNGQHSVSVEAIDNDGHCTVSTPIQTSVHYTNNFVSVNEAGDDAEETDGEVYFIDDDLDLGDDLVGLRFPNVNIPKGVHIRNAYLTFTSEEVSIAIGSVKIKGEKGNALPFEEKTNNLSARAKTSASVSWSPTWLLGGLAKQTENLSSIVQEIVNQSNWNKSNAMAFFIENGGNFGSRDALPFERGGITNLFIEYDYSPFSVPASGNTFTVCENGYIALDAGSGYTEYIWNNNTALNQQTLNAYQAGNYSLEVALNNDKLVRAVANSTVDFVINADIESEIWANIPNNTWVKHDIAINEGAAPYTFQWNTQGNVLSLTDSENGTANLIAAKTANISVIVTDAENCMRMFNSDFFKKITTNATPNVPISENEVPIDIGVLDGRPNRTNVINWFENGSNRGSKNNEAIGSFIAIFPNPARQKTSIAYFGGENNAQKLALNVFDVSGKTIAVYDNLNNLGKQELNVVSWPEGLYIVVLKNGDKVLHKEKIIVVK